MSSAGSRATGVAITLLAIALLAVTASGCAADHHQAPTAAPTTIDVHRTSTVVEDVVVVPRYDRGSCVLPTDARADLTFAIRNLRPSHVERLLAISSDAASMVVLSDQKGLTVFPAVVTAARHVNNERPPHRPMLTAVLQHLRTVIEPGTSVPVTFHFQRAGDLKVHARVPACVSTR